MSDPTCMRPWSMPIAPNQINATLAAAPAISTTTTSGSRRFEKATACRSSVNFTESR